jgi:hypothetical protein
MLLLLASLMLHMPLMLPLNHHLMLPSQSITMEMRMIGTWSHLARGLLTMLMLLIKMAIMLTIAGCKSSIYCRQVILKVKMNSMLQS